MRLAPKSVIMNALRCLIALLSALPLLGHGAFPALYMKPVCLQQIHSPTNITAPKDGSGRLFICDQPGKIHFFQRGMLMPTAFLDLSGTGLAKVYVHPTNLTVYSERGLLGMAFHPDFNEPLAPGYRRFYVNYTALPSTPTANPTTPQDCVTVISEFRVSANDPNVADPASERILLTYGQPQFNHNGGQIEFGPDGLLYIGSGDGGSANDNNAGHTGGSSINPRPNGILGNGQDRRVLLGKILRIDPLGSNGPGGQYGIPADNPFVGMQQDFTNDALDGPMRGEIFAYGLRNPWRFCFDSRAGGTNRMYCGDVGQGKVEEVNLITKGGNYGWRYREGSFVFDALMATNGIAPATPTDPIAQYKHPNSDPSIVLPELGLSVTGGYVYRGSAIPSMVGKYVFGDYGATSGSASGRLMGLEESAPGSGTFTLVEALPITNGNPFNQHVLCLGEDEAGEIYVGTKITAGVTELSGGLPAGGLYKLMFVPPAGTMTLSDAASIKDTTIYSESDFSNGSGSHFFAGSASTAGIRRAFLSFALNANTLPSGAYVTGASLQLYVNQQAQSPVAGDFTLHKATTSWGEGASNSDFQSPGPGFGIAAAVGDATWQLQQVTTVGTPPLGTAWSAVGGDFIPTSSASANISSTGSVTFTNAQLAVDVQSWINNPSINFGWCLRGPENDLLVARRFTSRNSTNASQRPRLVLQYAFTIPPTHFESWLATHFPTEPIGFFLDEEADLDNDGISNRHEYAYGFSPVVADENSGFTVSTLPGGGSNTLHRLTFRRDSAATDLTYQLQTSPDLINWTTIATSIAGTGALGSNGGSVLSDVVQTGTIRLVTVQESLAPVVKTRRFVRLQVQRSF